MVRRLVLLAFVAAAVAAGPRADALESQLAGVRLDQPAMDLFNQKPYGPPDFFGPVGTTITYGIAAAPQPGMGGAAPSGFGFSPTGFGRGAAPIATAGAGESGQMYWLYNEPGDVTITLGITAGGRVNSIVVAGRYYPGAVTQGGVKLGDGYLSVLDKYGFPDSTSGGAGNLVLGYPNAGLTLTLTDLRVTTIALAAAPPPVPAGGFAPAAGAAGPAVAPAVPVGPGAPGAPPVMGQRPGLEEE